MNNDQVINSIHTQTQTGLILSMVSLVDKTYPENSHTKQGLSPGAAKYPHPPTHHPLSESVTVGVCTLCCTWFGD